jgi:hypothetical protein
MTRRYARWAVRFRDVLNVVDVTPSLRPLLGSVRSNLYG